MEVLRHPCLTKPGKTLLLDLPGVLTAAIFVSARVVFARGVRRGAPIMV
jgi:hypothetical protein